MLFKRISNSVAKRADLAPPAAAHKTPSPLFSEDPCITDSPLLKRAYHQHNSSTRRRASSAVPATAKNHHQVSNLRKKKESFTFGSATAIVGSIVCSVGIVMVNKHVLNSGFPFPSTLTALHQFFGFIFSRSLIAWDVIPKLPNATATQHVSRFAVAVLYSTGLVLMNQSLGVHSVTYFQMLKMSCIPTIAGLQFLMYGVTLSKRTLAALSFILLGVFVAIANDDNSSQTLSHTTHNPHNTAFQSVLAYVTHLPVLVSLSTILTTSLSQILLNRSPDLKRMSSLQIISAISFTSFLVCATSAVAVDVGVSLLDWIRLILSFVGSNPLISAFIPQSYEALLFSGQDIDQARQTPAGGQDNLEFLDGMSSRAYLVEHILGKFISFFNKITQASGHSNGAGVLGWVFVSCLLSVLTNLLGFAVIKRTSAITFQVIGHFKTVATLAIGSILFGYEGFLGLKGVGLAVALLGMMLYSQK